jgi:predicted metal-dependent hydrolase
MPDLAASEARPPITPRNVRFAFDPSLPADWHSGEPGITVFYDALSLTFPEGERFFINSVRNFTALIDDPALKRDVEAFTSQESIHSREHAAYNALLEARGIPVEKFERLIRAGVRFASRHLPKKAALAATCAYEHYTALFAELLLGDRAVLADAHPFYRDLWRWHAMEEEEHKAVAFDVYQTVARDRLSYLRRVIAMVVVTFDFWITSRGLMIWLMVKRRQLWNVRAWARTFWHLWVSPGVWRRIMAGVFGYMVPGFHPWKREVHPDVLAWRNYYRQSVKRAPVAGSIFDTANA